MPPWLTSPSACTRIYSGIKCSLGDGSGSTGRANTANLRHASKKSLEVYQHLSLASVQPDYQRDVPELEF